MTSKRGELPANAPTPDAPIPDAPIPDTPIPDAPIPDAPIPEGLAEAVADLLDSPGTARADERLEALLRHPHAMDALAEEVVLRAALAALPPRALTAVQVDDIMAAMGVSEEVSPWQMAAGAARGLGQVLSVGVLPWQAQVWAGMALARGAQDTWRGAGSALALRGAMTPLAGIRPTRRGSSPAASRSLALVSGSLRAARWTARRVRRWL